MHYLISISSRELMHEQSIFSSDDWKSYSFAKPNTEFLHNNVKYLTTYLHKNMFLHMFLS